MRHKFKKSVLSFLAFTLVMTSSGSALAISLGELIVGIGTGLISGAICRELGASRDLQAFCAIGGAFLGAEAAKEMNRQDAEAFNRAQEDAFRGDLNRPYDWDARSNTGVRGRLIVVEEGYHYQTRETCRVYESQVYYSRGRSENKRTVVCQRSNGGLYTIESVNYYRNGRWTGGQTVETETRPEPRGPIRNRPERIRNSCQNWSVENVRYGQQVYTRRGTVAIFQRYDRHDGLISVNEFGSPQRYYMNDIAISGCHYGIQTGRRVSTTSRNSGVLLGIFMNGDALVDIHGFLRVFPRHELYF
jgi:surface antigen